MDGLSFALLHLGLLVLSVSIERHHKQLFYPNGSAVALGVGGKRGLRVLGFGLILACVYTSVSSLGIGLGLAYVCGALSLAAMALSLSFSFLPSRLVLLAAAGVVLAAAATKLL